MPSEIQMRPDLASCGFPPLRLFYRRGEPCSSVRTSDWVSFTSRAAARSSVPLRDLEDFLSGVGVDEVGVIGSDVGLNLLDQFVLVLGFDCRATWAVDLHALLPQS
jgi:hypothetical protein